MVKLKSRRELLVDVTNFKLSLTNFGYVFFLDTKLVIVQLKYQMVKLKSRREVTNNQF